MLFFILKRFMTIPISGQTMIQRFFILHNCYPHSYTFYLVFSGMDNYTRKFIRGISSWMLDTTIYTTNSTENLLTLILTQQVYIEIGDKARKAKLMLM
jgi:hypothetical protein